MLICGKIIVVKVQSDDSRFKVGNVSNTPNTLLAVISALKTLQEKIAQLEKEKSSARNKMVELENELTRTKCEIKEEVSTNQLTGRPRDSSKSDIMLEKLSTSFA